MTRENMDVIHHIYIWKVLLGFLTLTFRSELEICKEYSIHIITLLIGVAEKSRATVKSVVL